MDSSFLSSIFLSFLSSPNSFHFSFPISFLSFSPSSLSFLSPLSLVYSLNLPISNSSIYRHCLLILVASELKKVHHLQSFVNSIDYSTVRSAESFLNLAPLLSILIHKCSLLGLTRFMVGYQKSSPMCMTALGSSQLYSRLLPPGPNQSNISYPLAQES